ncbi:putative DNA packaging protein [Testudinid alphaherpesvirus 3]|uniref:Putative DNA packaging protein n=1 Tax=Testudinid alphaherpesvirus 3 TaxID=2560801 RepID=A0A0K1R1W3_9ALPH|nr:putative DNA packaging protein [Testudinid alphaherpesvirus 3]
MFGQMLAAQTKAYYESLKRKRRDDEPPVLNRECLAEDMSFLNTAISCVKRHQSTLPLVGTVHGCNEAFSPFMFASNTVIYETLTARALGEATPKSFVIRSLKDALDGLVFETYNGRDLAIYANAYNSTMDTIVSFIEVDEFKQLTNFICKFRAFLSTSFRGIDHTGVSNRKKAYLELFQKMILMHATYFTASIYMREHAEKTDSFLKNMFNNLYFTNNILKHFKQRTTVFLVPRRHGKTWFLVPLIAMLLSSFKGLKIGYTAHIRKATEPVFDEIERKLSAWYDSTRVDHVKGETISFTFDDGTKSSIVFASSHNTNVSFILDAFGYGERYPAFHFITSTHESAADKWCEFYEFPIIIHWNQLVFLGVCAI